MEKDTPEDGLICILQIRLTIVTPIIASNAFKAGARERNYQLIKDL